ncbi:MAG: SPASM domain-containing protein, partial [Oligoflexia bacterium]|nr:SPASM domain-containing protein [Oligoflexia bacterium]
LDSSHQLFKQTGRKLVIANFANALAGILSPTERKLMCDISPCGGGRCFVAISAKGKIFPCSEFIGLTEFSCGNIKQGGIQSALEHSAMKMITTRSVEKIEPCNCCSIRHFCGAPCPAELMANNGNINTPAIYCRFYQEQIRYAFRTIVTGNEEDYLW